MMRTPLAPVIRQSRPASGASCSDDHSSATAATATATTAGASPGRRARAGPAGGSGGGEGRAAAARAARRRPGGRHAAGGPGNRNGAALRASGWLHSDGWWRTICKNLCVRRSCVVHVACLQAHACVRASGPQDGGRNAGCPPHIPPPQKRKVRLALRADAAAASMLVLREELPRANASAAVARHPYLLSLAPEDLRASTREVRMRLRMPHAPSSSYRSFPDCAARS